MVQVHSTDDALTINTGIPHHGSVWFLQVLSTDERLSLFGAAREMFLNAAYRKDLNDPHTAVMWDSRTNGAGLFVERT